jgi:hypothetical protein
MIFFNKCVDVDAYPTGDFIGLKNMKRKDIFKKNVFSRAKCT